MNHMSRFLTILLLAAVASAGNTGLAAYSCAFSPDPFAKQVKNRFKQSPAVFVGEVIEIVNEHPPNKEPLPPPLADLFRPRPVIHTRFAVIERFKGNLDTKVEHSIDMGRVSIAGDEFSFEKRKRYLIYATSYSEDDGKVSFGRCGGSRLLGLNEKLDEEELALLRKLTKKLNKK
jgi:hypothetical protein